MSNYNDRNLWMNEDRYDYMDQMIEDVQEYIIDNYTPDEINEAIKDDRDELSQRLNDEMWADDSVTGNGSGSYFCNSWRAECALMHNLDLLAEACDEFDCTCDILKDGAEACDVTIRCYLLGQAIEAVLDEMEEK